MKSRTMRKNIKNKNKRDKSKKKSFDKRKKKRQKSLKKNQKGGELLTTSLGLGLAATAVTAAAYKGFRLISRIKDKSNINRLLNQNYIQYSPKVIVTETKDFMDHYLECISTIDFFNILLETPDYLKSKSLQSIIKQTSIDEKVSKQKIGEDQDFSQLEKILDVVKFKNDEPLERLNIETKNLEMNSNENIAKLRDLLLLTARIPGSGVDSVNHKTEDKEINKLMEMDRINPYLTIDTFRWQDVIYSGLYDEYFTDEVNEILKERNSEFLTYSEEKDRIQEVILELSTNPKFIEAIRGKMVECSSKPRGYLDYIKSEISWDSQKSCIACPDKDCLIYIYDFYYGILSEENSILTIDKIYALIVCEARICVLSKCLALEAIRVQERNFKRVRNIIHEIYTNDMKSKTGISTGESIIEKFKMKGGGVVEQNLGQSRDQANLQSPPEPPPLGKLPTEISPTGLSPPPGSSAPVSSPSGVQLPPSSEYSQQSSQGAVTESDLLDKDLQQSSDTNVELNNPQTNTQTSEGNIEPKMDAELNPADEMNKDEEGGFFDSLVSMVKGEKKDTPSADMPMDASKVVSKDTTTDLPMEAPKADTVTIDEKTNSLPDKSNPENIKYRNLLNRVLVVNMETNQNTERLFEVLEVSDTSDKKEVVKKFLDYKMGDDTTLYDLFTNIFRNYPGDDSYRQKQMAISAFFDMIRFNGMIFADAFDPEFYLSGGILFDSTIQVADIIELSDKIDDLFEKNMVELAELVNIVFLQLVLDENGKNIVKNVLLRLEDKHKSDSKKSIGYHMVNACCNLLTKFSIDYDKTMLERVAMVYNLANESCKPPMKYHNVWNLLSDDQKKLFELPEIFMEDTDVDKSRSKHNRTLKKNLKGRCRSFEDKTMKRFAEKEKVVVNHELRSNLESCRPKDYVPETPPEDNASEVSFEEHISVVSKLSEPSIGSEEELSNTQQSSSSIDPPTETEGVSSSSDAVTSSSDVAQPPSDAVTPSPDIAQPSSDAVTPSPDLAQPPSDAVTPSSDVAQPPSDAVTPSPDIAQPSSDAVTSSPDLAQPSPDVAQPSPDIAQPSSDAVTPSPDVAQPSPDVAQPPSDAVTPSPDVPQPPLAAPSLTDVPQPPIAAPSLTDVPQPPIAAPSLTDVPQPPLAAPPNKNIIQPI